MSHRRSERGQASLLAVGVLVVAVLASVLVGRIVVAAVHQANAQHAADAAALAGVAGGESAAAELASANGAELVDYRSEAGRAGGVVRVTVTVRRGERTARATAEGDPARRRHDHPGGGGTPVVVRVLYAR